MQANFMINSGTFTVARLFFFSIRKFLMKHCISLWLNILRLILSNFFCQLLINFDILFFSIIIIIMLLCDYKSNSTECIVLYAWSLNSNTK